LSLRARVIARNFAAISGPVISGPLFLARMWLLCAGSRRALMLLRSGTGCGLRRPGFGCGFGGGRGPCLRLRWTGLRLGPGFRARLRGRFGLLHWRRFAFRPGLWCRSRLLHRGRSAFRLWLRRRGWAARLASLRCRFHCGGWFRSRTSLGRMLGGSGPGCRTAFVCRTSGRGRPRRTGPAFMRRSCFRSRLCRSGWLGCRTRLSSWACGCWPSRGARLVGRARRCGL